MDTLSRAFREKPADYWFQHLADACVSPVIRVGATSLTIHTFALRR
jgi:hypothetical protein